MNSKPIGKYDELEGFNTSRGPQSLMDHLEEYIKKGSWDEIPSLLNAHKHKVTEKEILYVLRRAGQANQLDLVKEIIKDYSENINMDCLREIFEYCGEAIGREELSIIRFRFNNLADQQQESISIEQLEMRIEIIMRILQHRRISINTGETLDENETFREIYLSEETMNDILTLPQGARQLWRLQCLILLNRDLFGSETQKISVFVKAMKRCAQFALGNVTEDDISSNTMFSHEPFPSLLKIVKMQIDADVIYLFNEILDVEGNELRGCDNVLNRALITHFMVMGKQSKVQFLSCLKEMNKEKLEKLLTISNQHWQEKDIDDSERILFVQQRMSQQGITNEGHILNIRLNEERRENGGENGNDEDQGQGPQINVPKSLIDS